MKEYLLIQVAAAAAIGIAAWRTLPETMMCAACGQLQKRKPANKKSSPKMSLTEEKIAGGR